MQGKLAGQRGRLVEKIATALPTLGGLDSGNWHPHRLQAYPVSARADAAKRGLPISVVSSAIAFVGTSCDFAITIVLFVEQDNRPIVYATSATTSCI